MASFQEQIIQINKLRSAYDKADSALYSKKLDVQQRLKPENQSEIIAELRTNETSFQRSRKELNAAINLLHVQNPRFLTKELLANTPILLLPVRIETRFVNPPVTSNPELWLRIFPDDIHANSHEPVLTQKEFEAGQQYWISLSKSVNDEEKKGAWVVFKLIVTGSQRALWVAKNTKPTNWPDTNLAAPAELLFPEQTDLKSHTWTQAPRTQALPDRFVVSIFKNDLLVFEQTGAVIPDTVFLGPDPFLGEKSLKKEGDDIKFHEDIAWLQNFDKAVSIGLGMKIAIKPNMFGANGQIERITVLGLLHSADAAKGTNIVEKLFENHHYSAKGLSLLPQGTATNNTEKDNSGYTKNEDTLKNGFYQGNPIASIESASDIALLSNFLGINFNIFNDLNNHDLKEHNDSLTFNRALYAGTLSHFFNELMNPAVKPADAIQIRSFFTSYVSARGPLPAIRVGDQPYGILVSSDISRWVEGTGKNFFNGLSEVLRRLQKVWDNMAKNHSLKVGMPGNTSEILLKILGLQSGSVAFRQRLGNLPDFSYSMPNINIDTFNIEIKNLNQRIVDFLTTLGFNAQADGNFYPLISNLIFYNWTNSIPSKKLVSTEKHSLENAFLPKLPKSGLNYIQWISKTTTVASLEDVNFGGDTPPRTLLCLLLRHAMLTELKHSTINYLNTNGVAVNAASFEKSLFNFNKEAPDLSTYELLRADARKINDTKFRETSTGVGDFLLKSRTFVNNAELNEMRKAMKLIGEMPVADLEKHLANFIDLCSYRLDSWQTGLFTRRMIANRKTNPTGVYIGAYGWIENLKSETHIPVANQSVPEKLRPENGKPIVKLRENAGFSHLPSLNHATAAGVLLAGYHNHSKSTKPETFALNLSSERTRKALSIFEGIRNGQSLEVLLGYQFERALHDATSANSANNLNIYIAIFRNKYEIQQVSIPQQGAAEAQETIDSYPVCNGLKIQKASDLEIKSLVSNPVHLKLILEIRDKLSDILDACNDLLLAEGAFQMTQGNRDRTAGVTNSTLFADMPPEIQVVDTPRSSLLTYTHKVSLHFGTGDNLPLAMGWENNFSPKSEMEPGLNQWLSTIIGNPQNIICRVAAIDVNGNETLASFISLAQLNLQPIDLVYLITEDLTGGATELESRLAFLFRQQTAIEPNVSVKIEFKPIAIGEGNITFAQIYPILRQLKLLITNSRVADARDFTSKTKTINTNVAAINFLEFSARLEKIVAILKQNQTEFNSVVPNDLEPKDETNPETMEAFFNLIITNGDETGRISGLALSENALKTIENYHILAASFGLQLAYPENLNFITLQKIADLLSKTFNIWKLIAEKIKIAETKLSIANTETDVFAKNKALIECSKALLGDDFVAIPQFSFTNIDELSKTLADENQLLKFGQEKTVLDKKTLLNTWVQSIARVRPEMDRFEKLRMMTEAISDEEIDLQAIQIPFRNEDSWLGFELPELYSGKPFNILSDTHSIAVLGEGIKNIEAPQSAIIIDEWTEKIPIDNEITGIAYHYNQPNAMAPQSLILAVEPTGGLKWDWDILQGVLNDTLRRAKTRAVEPDHLMENDALRVLLPMTVASFDVNETNVSLDYLLLSDRFYATVKSSNMALYQKWNKTN